MTSSPNVLQWVGVSTTARPVMHSADMAVKAASHQPVTRPSSDAAGAMSRTVPTAQPTR